MLRGTGRDHGYAGVRRAPEHFTFTFTIPPSPATYRPQDKQSLKNAKQRLLLLEDQFKTLSWEHEVLQQRYDKVCGGGGGSAQRRWGRRMGPCSGHVTDQGPNAPLQWACPHDPPPPLGQ